MKPEEVAAKGKTPKGKRQVGLEQVAKLWPTPEAGDAKAHQCHSRGPENPTLYGSAQRFSLPVETPPTNGELSLSSGPFLSRQPRAKRRLNPWFSGWLMGLPVGWQDHTATVTPTSYSWWETAASHSLRHWLRESYGIALSAETPSPTTTPRPEPRASSEETTMSESTGAEQAMEWTQRRNTFTAALEGELKVGNVILDLFEYGPQLNHDWSCFGGVENEARTVEAAFWPWIVNTRAEAEERAIRLGKRLRAWANGQGPETIPALGWEPNDDGKQVARCGLITAELGADHDLWVTAHIGEPETEDHLQAYYSKDGCGTLYGYYEFADEASAKAFAQTAVAEMARWLGGDPLAAE